MYRCVFSADWHQSWRTWHYKPAIVRDSFDSLEQIVSFCLQHQCPLLAGGDLLDKDRPDPAAVGWLYLQMSRMEEAGLPVYYIQGQHERADPTWMSVHPWPTHVDRKCWTIEGVGTFYGLDWRPRGAIQEEFGQMPPGVDYLLCHQVWQENMGNIGKTDCSVFDVPYPLTLLSGDFHDHFSKYLATPQGRVRMVSNGSISMRSISEPVKKSFWVFDETELVTVPLDTRNRVDSVLYTAEDLPRFSQAVADAVHPRLGGPLCRVHFPPEVPHSELERIVSAAQGALFPYPVEGDTQELAAVSATADIALSLTELVQDEVERRGGTPEDTSILVSWLTVTGTRTPAELVEMWVEEISKGAASGNPEGTTAELVSASGCDAGAASAV